MEDNAKHICRLEELSSKDVSLVGGKNASFGEMIGTLKVEGIRVPGGFATTADAYGEFLEANDLTEKISRLIQVAHKAGCKVGICGQAPSDYPEFARFLAEEGIDSISLNPDSVIEVVMKIAEFEKKGCRF